MAQLPVDGSGAKSGAYADTAFKSVTTSITATQKDITTFQTKAAAGTLSEVDMIEFNMAASRYSTMVSMGSGLIKNLTDTEKQVANKM